MTEEKDDIDPRKALLELLPEEEIAALLDEGLPRGVIGKPARRLNAAELKFLLSRNLGLDVAAPLAVALVEADLFLQAEGHPGDLLVVLLESSGVYWRTHPELWQRVIEVLERLISALTDKATQEELGAYMPWYLGDDFMGALMHFRGIIPEEGEE